MPAYPVCTETVYTETGGLTIWVAISSVLLAGIVFLLPVAVLFAVLVGGSTTPGKAGQPPSQWIALTKAAALTCKTPTGTKPALAPVLLAIGDVESSFGESTLPGVRSGHNSAGAEGPMQFLPPTFAYYDHPVPSDTAMTPFQPTAQILPGGIGIGIPQPESPYDVVDAVYAAARLLCSDGYAAGLPSFAIYAYNHSAQYVNDVLGTARIFSKQYHM